jgi:hypothetical protein
MTDFPKSSQIISKPEEFTFREQISSDQTRHSNDTFSQIEKKEKKNSFSRVANSFAQPNILETEITSDMQFQENGQNENFDLELKKCLKEAKETGQTVISQSDNDAIKMNLSDVKTNKDEENKNFKCNILPGKLDDFPSEDDKTLVSDTSKSQSIIENKRVVKKMGFNGGPNQEKKGKILEFLGF